MKYNITIVSDDDSWINEFLPNFQTTLRDAGHSVRWIHQVKEITQGDFVFFLSCGQMVSPSILLRNRHNLVVHESALPKGKGWSPLSWQVLEGKNEVPVSLFEAVEHVDSGDIYLKETMRFVGTELVDELRKIQAETSIKMCLEFIRTYPDVVYNKLLQKGESTFYKKRTAADSKLDINSTIKEQFNLLRIVDNERYPAYFEMNGETYVFKIYKRGK